MTAGTPGGEPAAAAHELERRRAVRAWALYDFGNSAFATTVMAGFFPLFFKQFWNPEVEPAVSTFRLGVASSVASVLIALLAPLLGAIADQAGARKRMLALFAVLGASSTMLLSLVPKAAWLPAAALYAVGSLGFAGSIVFYDSLIVTVARADESHRVSALGYGLGYLGGGILFAINVAMTQAPERFGLADATQAVQVSFVMVGLWWLAFTVPLFLHVPETPRPTQGAWKALASGVRELSSTLPRLRAQRSLWMFLFAYWLYIDGVDTVIRMAVDYGLSIGLPSSSLITALLITQLVGFPAAILVGRIADRFGAKRTILACLCVYIGVTSYGYSMETASEFYVLACAIGLVQGGVQALSRSMWSRMVPKEHAAELFGLYNMLGKFAAIFGPLLMGLVSLLTGSTRIAILSIAVLFIAGGALLLRVPEPAPREDDA